MLCRSWVFAGLLFLGGCAYDAGYHKSNYASQPASAAGYYSPVGYTPPYVPASPVYGAPYVEGPVLGGIYVIGDDRDIYGGPIFSPYYGIRCDRRRNICWSRKGPEYGWSYRFFGQRHAYWRNRDWQGGDWQGGDWNHGGGPNPGGGNPNNTPPQVYQVPLEPDGSGATTFYPNN